LRLSNVVLGFKDFWNEFKHEKMGTVGLVLLGIFILTVFIGSFVIPFPQVNNKWRDISYWQDNPRGVPPVWVDFFSLKKHARSIRLTDFKMSQEQAEAMRIQAVEFAYDYKADIPPIDIVFHCYSTGTPVIILYMERPDGRKIELVRKPMKNGDVDREVRISVDKDAKRKTYNFGYQYDRSVDLINREMITPTNVLFAEAKKGVFRTPSALKGTYKFTAEILLLTPEDTVKNIYMNITGSVYGFLGTDNSKRDIWSGIVAGVKWALLIGLMTALVAVSIGVIYGVMSAYLGGWKDSLMQRIFEIFVSIPLLPLLIVMSAIFKPSIFTLIIMMSAFFWVGPVKTVRSIGLQIKEEVYIEASRSVGASDARIIFSHMVPLLVPYAFASMALYVPGAIVYESTISLLGLGDSTIVTWGQILHDALSGGAVLNGQWWWVIPPGLAIAMMGMTFAFIGFAMDKILHPKLRTR
jgi:peptide/nickel transport system permease protein